MVLSIIKVGSKDESDVEPAFNEFTRLGGIDINARELGNGIILS